MNEGNQIKTIGKILGAASMNIGAMVTKIDPSTEVAAQYVEGRSFGKYLAKSTANTMECVTLSATRMKSSKNRRA